MEYGLIYGNTGEPEVHRDPVPSFVARSLTANASQVCDRGELGISNLIGTGFSDRTNQ